MLIVVFSTGGCASVVGILVADVHREHGALVVTVEGFGVVVQTLADDGGISLGSTRRIYIYPEDAGATPENGRYFGLVALPAAPPLALDTRTMGLSVRATRREIGATLGYLGTTILAQVDADDSVYLNLSFVPSDPRATRLIHCRAESPCWAEHSGVTPEP